MAIHIDPTRQTGKKLTTMPIIKKLSVEMAAGISFFPHLLTSWAKSPNAWGQYEFPSMEIRFAI
jgi:hypothetical protein